MKINRLRLLGFKSFVEPTELRIERGLTGVVGPNGCGKSNLLEALRWVMGETSHKSMRAAAMDDVIFAGTSQRPARNMAEVTIFLDNKARSAPADYNETDSIEITRRIEREAGSAYRVNGREVRARDVKILFEDAATGARSPALVRQGQIGEIVNAKPEHRRRILEDAAGVAGLHSRRHDAELRLRAAEGNLARLADLIGSLSSQIDSLKRQARQARRYKDLSAEIRRAEAVAAHVIWSATTAQVEAETTALGDAITRHGTATTAEAAAMRHEAGLAESLPPLREAEAQRSAAVARLKIEQANVEKEAERAAHRRQEIAAQLLQLEADIAREAAALGEAGDVVARIEQELAQLVAADHGAEQQDDKAQADLAAARAHETDVQAHINALTRREVEARARRKTLAANLQERCDQAAKIAQQLASLKAQLAALDADAPDPAVLANHQTSVAELSLCAQHSETLAEEAEERLQAASVEATARRNAAQQANLDLRGIEAEQATLARILRPRSGDGLAPVLDQISVAPGYEIALGAALGDDLDAPVLMVGEAGREPPLHWRLLEAARPDAALPAGVERMISKVDAPPELLRRMAQIGIVDRARGAVLQAQLSPGQCLVSMAGDLWRWDGYVATADAPTASAERLAQKNRLIEIQQRHGELQMVAAAAVEADCTAQTAASAAEAQATAARQACRQLQARLAAARDQLSLTERAAQEAKSRRLTLTDAVERATTALTEAEAQAAKTDEAWRAAQLPDGLEAELKAAQDRLAAAREAVTELAGEAAVLARERRLRSERQAAARTDLERWTTRKAGASAQIDALGTRAKAAQAELTQLDALPVEIERQRQRLLSEISGSERQRQQAADTLAETETSLREAQQALRAAQAQVANEREARARIEAHLEAAKARLDEQERLIRDSLHCAPDQCLAVAGFPADGTLPSAVVIEQQLTRLKADRDKLGGVNLAADRELEDLNAQYEAMERERQDVEAAIAKLRGAIAQLNREGKTRIDQAFRAVDGHFQALFTTLFGGGEARLEMIEGEDPLEGGLEIIARPPGKKPATLSLLSGGEQTLTALSLIFAVFLTNPSPICVLDEVDAPLDDANVDRFATLMEKMATDTDTRFLVITHHPMTMARMDRLFGVTMGEKGVSQLVSVDLATAERIIDDAPQQAAG